MGDLDAGKLKGLAASLGAHAHPLAFDVSDFKQVEAAVRRAESQIGPIDVLVNNAGILSNNKVAETTPEEWHKVLSINLDGAFYLSKLILPGMKARRWGRIVNTCSYAMKSGGRDRRHGLHGVEGRAPGADLLAGARMRRRRRHGQRHRARPRPDADGYGAAHQGAAGQEWSRMIPVGRFCEPEEFAHCVRFFVSPFAGFITGEILDLNGGLQFD